MSHREPSCREVLDFLADYLDGELPDATRSEFERHLAKCPECVEYLDGYREAVRLGRLAGDPVGAPQEEVPEELVAVILASRRA